MVKFSHSASLLRHVTRAEYEMVSNSKRVKVVATFLVVSIARVNILFIIK